MLIDGLFQADYDEELNFSETLFPSPLGSMEGILNNKGTTYWIGLLMTSVATDDSEKAPDSVETFRAKMSGSSPRFEDARVVATGTMVNPVEPSTTIVEKEACNSVGEVDIGAVGSVVIEKSIPGSDRINGLL